MPSDNDRVLTVPFQICQFCYHKLLRDDPRCPGCRRTYDKESVVFQPVDFEE
jgi:CCR4-NOT transcription complex subunit 4